ncbi:MAG: peptide chain release factor N(5)-glutamine methyltransferase [Rhizomicrobium sp.]|jgi:release factor glutamine methyltransferase
MTEISAADEFARATRHLAAAGIESARLDARVLLAHAIGAGTGDVVSTRFLSEQERDEYEKLISRRAVHEPLAYIVGTKEFFSLDFEVGPGVLIPRPETETLIEQALLKFADRHAELRVLDLGTGSGCLIVAFLSHYPRASGVAVDLCEQALAWAKRNVVKHDLAGRCRLEHHGWNVRGQFDVVFSNPPYLRDAEFRNAPPEISAFEPKGAFVGGCDGLAAYRELAPELVRLLDAGGRAFIEIGKGQEISVKNVLATSGLDVLGVASDLGGIPRCIIADRPYGLAQQKTVGKAPATR